MNSGIRLLWLVSVNWVVWSGETGKQIEWKNWGKNWKKNSGKNSAEKLDKKLYKKLVKKLGKNLGGKVGRKNWVKKLGGKIKKKLGELENTPKNVITQLVEDYFVQNVI